MNIRKLTWKNNAKSRPKGSIDGLVTVQFINQSQCYLVWYYCLVDYGLPNWCMFLISLLTSDSKELWQSAVHTVSLLWIVIVFLNQTLLPRLLIFEMLFFIESSQTTTPSIVKIWTCIPCIFKCILSRRLESNMYSQSKPLNLHIY